MRTSEIFGAKNSGFFGVKNSGVSNRFIPLFL